MRKVLALTALALLPATLLAGQAVGGTAAKTVSIARITALKNGLRFDKKVVHAKAGRIEIVFSNPSSVPHNVRIESGENELGGTQVITKKTAKVFLTLKPGRYNFYCSVPGHEDAGMKGTLIVS